MNDDGVSFFIGLAVGAVAVIVTVLNLGNTNLLEINQASSMCKASNSELDTIYYDGDIRCQNKSIFKSNEINR
jgi:hypothetical protein